MVAHSGVLGESLGGPPRVPHPESHLKTNLIKTCGNKNDYINIEFH